MFSFNSFQNLAMLKNMLISKSPNELFNEMMETNPKFKEFYEANKDKTVEQVAKENNIDLNMIRAFFK